MVGVLLLGSLRRSPTTRAVTSATRVWNSAPWCITSHWNSYTLRVRISRARFCRTFLSGSKLITPRTVQTLHALEVKNKHKCTSRTIQNPATFYYLFRLFFDTSDHNILFCFANPTKGSFIFRFSDVTAPKGSPPPSRAHFLFFIISRTSKMRLRKKHERGGGIYNNDNYNNNNFFS